MQNVCSVTIIRQRIAEQAWIPRIGERAGAQIDNARDAASFLGDRPGFGVRDGSQTFPFRAFEKERRVSQGDIVSNKRLAAVLSKIQADQRDRDEESLAHKKVTLRKKQRIRRARAQADAPHGSP